MDSDSAQPANPATVARTVSLTQMRVGQMGVIQEKKLDEGDRAVLRAMGLACNATVKLCRAGEPCIVAVMTGGAVGGRLGGAGTDCCRIGLAKPLAEKIFVALYPATPVPGASPPHQA